MVVFMFDNVVIILVETSHPGNIGATARAMLTMGFTHLALVNPRSFVPEDVYPMASGADIILDQAKIYADFSAAIADCHTLVGTTARMRDFPWPVHALRQCATDIVANCGNQRIGLVFGPERTGLRNEHLECCQMLLHIPTNPDFSSLNLAQAVQLVCYELRVKLQENQQIAHAGRPRLATHGELTQLYAQMTDTFTQLEFLDPKVPRLLMRRMKRLVNRFSLEHEEVQILRGICTSIVRQLAKQNT
jgi:tRNA (cytidine32/uridine32-2'-O)-methyltransferase